MTQPLDRRTLLALMGVAATRPGSVLAQTGPAPTTAPYIEALEVYRQPARVRVSLPAGYAASDRRYPVLYLLDGQWAFAGDADGITLSADTRLAALARAGAIEPHIIVAIDNMGDRRFVQYMPQRILEQGGPGVHVTVFRELERVGATHLTSNVFASWMQRLKETVDRSYRTRAEPEHNAIFGASMAAPMAAALFITRPHMFGRCGCMSPNWAIYDARFIDHPGLTQVWADWFAELGPPAGRRLWLDHGTQMMDAGMTPYQFAIAGRLNALGWQYGEHLRAEVYDAGHAFAQTAVQFDDMAAWLLR